PGQGPGHAGGNPGRDLRGAGLAFRRRLRRQCEHVRRYGRRAGRQCRAHHRRRRRRDFRGECRRCGSRQRGRLRNPPRKDQGFLATAGGGGECDGGRGLRSGLSRRHDGLSRQASRRAGGQGQRAEQFARDRRSADLERSGLDILPAGCRRRPDEVAGMADAAVSATIDHARDAAAPSMLSSAVQAVLGRLVIIVPYLWLLVFFLAPFVIVFKISLSTTAIAMPPYTPVLGLQDGLAGLWEGLGELTLDNYLWLLDDPLYFNAYVSSV